MTILVGFGAGVVIAIIGVLFGYAMQGHLARRRKG